MHGATTREQQSANSATWRCFGHDSGNEASGRDEHILVQSEALQAIQRQGPNILGQDPTMLWEELLPSLELEHAKDMFLTTAGKDACMFLLQFFATAVTDASPTTVRECVSGVDLGIATSSYF
jgi:hypothetical protein